MPEENRGSWSKKFENRWSNRLFKRLLQPVGQTSTDTAGVNIVLFAILNDIILNQRGGALTQESDGGLGWLRYASVPRVIIANGLITLVCFYGTSSSSSSSSLS